jgi:dihydrofolate reductase
MRKLFLQINASLDGYIEDVGGVIDWEFVDTLRSIDGMVFGRVAYEKLADYWPTSPCSPAVGSRRAFSSSD